MAYQFLQLTITQHVAWVKLNRPPVNALNKEFVAELSTCAEQLKNNYDVWVVSVTAEGKAFCAGADLKERAGIPQQEVLQVVKGIQLMVGAWCELPQPVIMGIQAAALGGGLEFALAGDIIVASESAMLGLPETSLGIIPAGGGTQRLAQRTSAGIAKKWILTAKQFSANEALQDGIADYVFEDKTFKVSFEKIVQQVASNAPLALRQAKKAIERSYEQWRLEGFERETSLYQPLISTHDRTEGLTAFKEKRKPQWKGK